MVDDDVAVLKSLGRLLVSAGWKVEQFSNPEDFLRFAKIYQSPVAVVDVCMPTTNGLEVQSRLRDVSPSTRVIVFTAKEDSRVREAALQAGATAFFIKPFHDEEFLMAVRAAAAPLN